MTTSVLDVPATTAAKTPAVAVLTAVPLAGAMEIPLGQLVPSKTNRRTVRHAEADQELVESVRMRGVQEPIIVRPFFAIANTPATNARPTPVDADKYEIVCGHRRFEASQKAGKSTIPAIVKKLTNAEALEIQNIENLQRQDLDPLDRAEAIHDLYQQYLRAMTPKDAIAKIAGRLNCKERTLYNMMSLRNLLPDVQKAIAAEKISMSHGYILASLAPDSQKRAWEWVKDGIEYGDPISVRDLQDYIADEIFRRLSSATWNLNDAALVPAAGACSACPKNSAVNPNVAPQEKKATCTDPSCFETKKKGRLVQIQDEIKKEAAAGKLVRVAGDAVEDVPKGVIAIDGWRSSKPGSCEHTVAAIVATGSAKGEHRTVCIERGCKKHFPPKSENNFSAFDAPPRHALSESERKARLQKVRTKKLDEAYRVAAVAAIREKVSELKIDDLRDVAMELAERTDRRFRPPICEAMGWKVAKNSYYGPKIDRKQVDALKPAQLGVFMVLLAIADQVLPGLDYHAQNSELDFPAFAKRHKIDLAKIREQAEAPLKAKFKAIDARKKKAEASAASKPKAKKAKGKAA